MNKDEAIKVIQDLPDDEELFIVRGSHPAAPETLREFARRELHRSRLDEAGTPSLQRQARLVADEVFSIADRMEHRQTALRDKALEDAIKAEAQRKQDDAVLTEKVRANIMQRGEPK
jgi:hypothetical protein